MNYYTLNLNRHKHLKTILFTDGQVLIGSYENALSKAATELIKTAAHNLKILAEQSKAMSFRGDEP